MNLVERIIIGLLAVVGVGLTAAGITAWTERRRLKGMAEQADSDPHAEKLRRLRSGEQPGNKRTWWGNTL